MRRTLGKIVGRATGPVLVAVLAAAGLAVSGGTTEDAVELPEAQPVLGVQGQVHYLPLTGPDFLSILQGEHGGTGTGTVVSPVRIITSMVSALDSNQITVDHWEDGYDADPLAAPGTTTETQTRDEGETWVLNNTVPAPTPDPVPEPYPYDGRDRVVSSGAVVMTTGGWPTTAGTVHANAAVVPDVNRFGYEFVAPVGENATSAPATLATDSMWEYTGLLIQAAEDDTTVTVTGVAPFTLQAGETHLVNGGVDMGDTVNADKPVTVYLATGDKAPTSGYEGRMFNLSPTERWASSYVTPVASRGTGAQTGRVYLYNPGASAISVTVTPSTGSSSSISVPAGGTANYVVPVDVGARFSTTGAPFYALHAVTTPESGADSSSSYNWGFALTPETFLTPMVVIGYGPGAEPTGSPAAIPENDSVVWVSALEDGRLYIDLNADPSDGALTDPDGNQYDFHCDVNALQPRLIADDGTGTCRSASVFGTGSPAVGRTKGTGDADMTGARIYTVTDGSTEASPISAAWGQVSGLAAAAPAIDMGTTVLPFPTIDLDKTSEVVDDDGDGQAVPGDTIRYTVTITNRGLSPVDDLVLNDAVPVNTTYVAGSTTAGGNPVTDPGTGTAFPLDEGGMPVPPVLDVGETRTVTYDLLVDDPLPPGVTEVLNEITLESDYGIYTDINVQPMAEPGSVGDRVWNDADGDGTQDALETGYVGVTVELLDDEDTVVDTTTTGTNGAYSFDEVYPGTYTVRVVASSLPAGTAATYDPDGTATTDEASVTLAAAEDRSDVDFGYAASALTLDKTVYAGHDDGAGCPATGSELVSGETGDDVTYCFRVTNTGSIPLVDVGIDDPDLGIDEGDMDVESGSLATVAAGGSVVVSYSGAAITGDLTNTATAEAFVSAGGIRRTATDTAAVAVIGPGITLAKTVYRGHDGGASCGSAVESVTVRDGGPVTWCFLVTNSGQTNLSAVTFSDPTAGVAEGDQTHSLLAPAASHTFYVEGAAGAADVTNTATAKGTSPAGVQPTDDDTASLDVIDPSIGVANTVYASHSAGAGCDGAEQVSTLGGADVTWCFTVTNTGDAPLTDVTLEDLPLGVDESDLTLLSGSLATMAPGAVTRLYLQTTATADVDNVVTATGTPPVGTDVTDEDTAALDVIAPAIQLEKAVYLGAGDDGAGCDTASDEVAGEAGEDITWCFTITNTGDAPLTGITLDDVPLGIDETGVDVVSGDLADLDPDDVVVLAYEDTLDANVINVATASGSPVVGPDVSDEDAAGVAVLVPGVSITKTVYAGHDDGAGCPGSDSIQARPGEAVTWCVRVENTGEVELDVQVSDPDAGIDETVSDLAVDAVAWVYAEGTVDGDLVNTATGTGTTPLGDEVTDDDTADVDEIHPAISVAKTVYAGHDAGAGCEGVEGIDAEVGDDITWCFEITNSGDAPLTDVTLDDAVLGDIDEGDVTVLSGSFATLAPGASVVAHFDDTVDGNTVNNVTVSATPSVGSDPTDTDTASVSVIGPEIGVAKTILQGPTGNGDGTYTVVYGIRVVNSGETALNDVQVVDDLTETFDGAASFTVDGVASDDFTVNAGYDGRPTGSTELLGGSDDLARDAVGEVILTVTLDPGDHAGPYENTADASATSPGGQDVQDASDSGLEPEPSDPNTGEPGDTSGTDDPVPLVIPAVDLTVEKTVDEVTPGPLSTAVVDWRIQVHNEGPGDDPGPITVIDELDDHLTLVSATGDGWDCDGEDQTVTCVWAEPLPAGASTSELQVLTDAVPPEDGGAIPNGAHVESSRTESRTDNNDDAAEVDIDVDAASPDVPSSLPRTGAAIGGLLLLGLGLVFGGRLLQRRAQGSVA